jgi:hypothetical protein
VVDAGIDVSPNPQLIIFIRISPFLSQDCLVRLLYKYEVEIKE